MRRAHALSIACRLVALALCLDALASSLSAHSPLHERIDAAIEAGLVGSPSPAADDATICRRLYLDFFGRVPSAAETRAYLADPSPDKRARLVDSLLAAPEFARQLSVWLDVTLMERRADKNVPTAEWRKYLFDAALANKPFDQLVREILSADGSDPATRPAAKFYLDRDGEPFALTRDVGRMFFGMDLQCAQCHDHPLVDDYHQEDYHGLLAFLNRTTLFTDAENKVSLAEKAEGETNYQSVFDPDQKGTIGPTLPGGLQLAEPTFPKGEEYLVAPADKVRSVPKHSRRALLAAAATDGRNRAFNRNLANRLWAFLFGKGLVEPLDFQHSANPASQPAVLELLAAEVTVRKYDLRALLREMALTRAYARALDLPAETSQWAAESSQRLPESQAACEACKQALNASSQAARDARTQAEAVRQTEQQAAAAADQARATLAAAEQAIKGAQAAKDQAQAQLAAKQTLAQTLADAAAKTAAAAAQLPDDQELAAALATVKNRGEAVAAALAGLSQTMSQCEADMGAKETSAAAQRETLMQADAKLAAVQAEATAQNTLLESAAIAAARDEASLADAEQRLAWLKAMTAYREALDAVQIQEAAHREALAQLATLAVAANEPLAVSPAEALSADSNVEGIATTLAATREQLLQRQVTAQGLLDATAAATAAKEVVATAHAAADEAYLKVQAKWSNRCLAGDLVQLTPEQLAWSTWQTLGVLEQQRAAAAQEWEAAHPADGGSETPEQRASAKARFIEQKVYDNLQGSVGTFVNLFGGAPGQPQQVFQATADQALFFANGGELRSWLAPGGGNLTERLLALPDAQVFADELYLTVFTRQPTADEVASLQAYLAPRESDRAAAVQEIIWALVTSAEFRFGS